MKGFKILGAAAKQAVPALIDIYEQHSSLLFISSFALLAAVGMTFIDVRMPPGWDGVETTVNIWKFDPDLQVLIHPCVFAIYSSLTRRVLA